MQKANYKNYEEINEKRLLNQSEKVYNKFTVTNQKSRDLKERNLMTVDDHKQRNEERFYTRDEGLQRVEQQRSEFLRREENRHNLKIEARERILFNMSVNHE